MARTVMLHVILDEVANPDAERDLDDLLALANRPGSGVRIERIHESDLVSLLEIEAFMATHLPAGTDPKRIREVARQFYVKLPHWSTAKGLPLRLICPFCRLSPGVCRCQRMGWDMHYQRYFRETTDWLLDPQSVQALTDVQLAGVHVSTRTKLAAFRTYLTQQQPR